MCAGVVLLLGLCAGAVESVDALLSVLEEQGIPFEREGLGAAAVEGVLQRLDPGSRVLSREEADTLEQAAKASRPERLVETAERRPDGIGYVRIAGLFDGAGGLVAQAMAGWTNAAPSGVILDIRGAGGDDLASVARVAGLFAEPGVRLFIEYGGTGAVTHAAEAAPGASNACPVVALIDGGTSGAAEILAAVLRECVPAVLVGARTQGAPLSRRMIPLPDGRVLHMAVRHVQLPSGAECGPAGVGPDVDVEVAPPRKGQEGVAEPADKGGASAGPAQPGAVQDAALTCAADILRGLGALGGPVAGATPAPGPRAPGER